MQQNVPNHILNSKKFTEQYPRAPSTGGCAPDPGEKKEVERDGCRKRGKEEGNRRKGELRKKRGEEILDLPLKLK